MKRFAMIERALPAALLLLAGGAAPRVGADDPASLAPGARVKVTAAEHVAVPALIEVRGNTVLSTRHFERAGDLWVAAGEAGTLAVPKPKATIAGDYQGATAYGVFLRPKGRDDVVQVPRAAIAQMKVRTRKGEPVVGGLAGAAVGFALGWKALSCDDFGCIPAAGGVLFALPAAVLGAWAGQALDRWELVETPAVRVSIVPPPRASGPGAAVCVRF